MPEIEVESTPPMPEPAGLWAVVEHVSPEYPDDRNYLVKGPGGFDDGTAYWFSLGGEDGWGWEQVLRWPGTVRLVREGVTDA
ncbi:MAG TPA: hypothetical protein VFG33_00100 [Kribbella sp.]|uniref:hypothetical protein n=1 Tax=Kribbella sp. TaxID=1871183 RepID=UPI002D79C5E0|nr:hypothetical protein [Kribbella sp.]HET6291731.1 hypothetical protein [Kribbella sp.]